MIRKWSTTAYPVLCSLKEISALKFLIEASQLLSLSTTGQVADSREHRGVEYQTIKLTEHKAN